MMILTLPKAFALLGLIACVAPLASQSMSDTPVRPVNVILDSDMADNADDVGDHAMLWALAANGEVNVLALIASSTNDYTAACMQAIATYYGHPNVPIGANQTSIPNAYHGYFSYYTPQVAQQFGYPGKTRNYYPAAPTVYRQALAAAPDHSVYIVAGGFFRPLMDLLQSGPDAISPLTGMQLVAQKVKRLLPVAGRFPDSSDNDHGNLAVDPDSASYVIANWPTEIVWMPDDQTSDVITGPAANADPNVNPVKLAYNLYCSNGLYCANTTPAWTQTALLYTMRGGIGTYFGIGGQEGSTVVWDSTTSIPGRSIWSQLPDRHHGYLVKFTDPSILAGIINPLVQWIPPRNPITQPPVANSQSVTAAGVSVPITLTGSDPQNAALTFTVATQPVNGSLSGVAPNLTYTPNSGFVGNDSFTFWVGNGYYLSSVATVSITVTAPNQPPVSNSQSVTTYGTPISITLAATDAENETLTYAIVSQPFHGTLTGTPPAVTYTPAWSYNGADSFTFRASDAHGTSNVATVSITVDLNSPPYRMRVNAGGPSITDVSGNVWQADTGYSGATSTYSTTQAIAAVTGDPRLYQTERYASNIFQYSSSNLPNGAYTVNLHFAEIASGCFYTGCRQFDVLLQGNIFLHNFDPYAAANGGNIAVARSTSAVVSNGTLTITLQAAATLYPTLSAIDFVFQAPNSPGFGSISGTVIQAGTNTPISGALVAHSTDSTITDVNGHYLFTHLAPGGYTLTVSNRAFPNASQLVTVTGGATATLNFALTGGITKPPVANSQSISTAGLAVPVTLTASDPQGAQLSYTVASLPAHGSLSGTSPNLTYTPAAGYVGSDSFTFTASNGYYQSNIATVSIVVTPANQPPVANPQSVTSYGGATPIVLAATDAENEPLTYAIVSQPFHGTLSGVPPAVTYTPAFGYQGGDSFTFQAIDAHGSSNVATVSITVDLTSPPYRMRVNAGGPSITDANGNVWQADTAYSGTTYTYSTTQAIAAITGDPRLYQTERYASNVFTYTFPNLPNGTYTVNLHFAEIASGCFYTGCRQFDVLLQGNIFLHNFDPYAAANGGNIAVARSTSAVVSNGTLTITLQAAATLYPTLSAIDFVFQAPNSPGFGSISGIVTQAGTNTPISGALVACGTDSKITDTSGHYLFTHLAPGGYTLTVSNRAYPNTSQAVTVTSGATATLNFALTGGITQPPVANSQSVTTSGATVPITLTASDPQNAPLTYAVATQPAHGSLSGTAPSLAYTPTAGYVGSDSFTFSASNGFYQSNVATVSITVTAANQPPVANSQTLTSYGGALPITLTATDAENEPLTYTILTQPGHGALSGTPPSVVYTPAAGYNGPDSFTFQASDAHGTSNVATISITVNLGGNPYTLRVNAGGPSITDTGGRVWQADTGYLGTTYTFSTTSAITSLSGADPRLYQTERYTSGPLQYAFSNLPTGNYAVKLHFAEIDGCNYVGCRVFNVAVQGVTVWSNFDVFATAGGANIGIVQQTTAAVTNGTMSITLQAGYTQYPTISAIELIAQ